MGLGLQVRAEVARKSTWPWSAKEKLTPRLAEAIAAAIDDPLLRDLAQVIPGESTTEVLLHSAAENLYLTEDSKSGVDCSIKTSTCGPGFHAYVVDLLEKAAAATGAKLTLTGDNYGDETNYWLNRSETELKRAMAAWLRSVSHTILRHTDYDNLMVNMPQGFPPLADKVKHYAVTPMGPRTREWFELAAQSVDDALRQAPGFFPWWNVGFDGDSWRGLGLVLAWGNLSWSCPIDDQQRATYQLALEAFRRAKTMGAGGLPEPEIAEIESLLSADESSDLPPPDQHPTRVGYRRRCLERPLTGHWHVALPGYYFNGDENDGETIVYWYGSRAVRGSSLTVSHRTGRRVEPREMVEKLEEPDDPAAEVLDERDSDPPGWAIISLGSDEQRDSWELSGQTGAPNEICLTTINFSDRADRDWAIETWRSVRRRPTDD